MSIELDTQRLNVFVAHTRTQRIYANKTGIPWKKQIRKEIKVINKIISQENVAVIMGRLTFEDIGRPLENKQTIVVSNKMTKREGVKIFSTFEDALTFCRQHNYTVVIFGGCAIYQAAMAHPCKFFVTLIDDMDYKGEKIFPENQVKLTCVDENVRDLMENPEHNGEKFMENGVGYNFYVGFN
ncbi:Dihydrofolate reductase [Pseudoloma neurophilia]|uniref:Dihydrofolate reductase n=1 Tax=Pseudoloma neurophilia TaxID=146866 RepID=A0A0R0LYK5_9MICR|nr:Dihydrofolate reductase [Pseudoloma neurophilia]